MRNKILFVEDDEDIRTVVDILLKRAGYEVIIYADESFVKHIEADEQPGMYLLDRRVGKLDTLETCYLLKTHAKTKHIPVIMVSADPTVKDLYKDAGADAFIAKPFNIDAFLATIAKFLKP